MRAPLLSLLSLVSLLWLTGCLDLDEQFLVHDLRILAVKTEPAELVLDSAYAGAALIGGLPGGPGGPGGGGGLPLPEPEGFTVDIEVFAYDPRGGLVTLSTSLCPDSVDSTCVGWDPHEEVLDPIEDEEERDEREALFLPSETTAEIKDLDVDPIGRAPLPTLTWEMTPSVISALTANAFGSAAVGVETIEPRVVIELDSDQPDGVTHTEAFKRIPLIWDLHDPALEATVNAALAPYDVDLCPTDQPTFEEEGPAPCARVREPNQNPVLLGFDIVDELAEEEEADPDNPRPAVREGTDPQLGPNPTILVEPGGVLRIRPVFAPGSIERYQVIVNDPNTNVTTVEDRFEDFAAHWFVTRGTVELLTQGWTSEVGPPGQPPIADLDGRWELPSRSEIAGVETEESGFPFGGPPGGGPGDDDDVDIPEARDAVVVVIKDQRGGTAVGQIIVEYAQ
jgi:hypothetical protein